MQRFHLLLLLVPGCTVEPARADEKADRARAARVDRLFETWTRPNSPGCALGIIRDGKLIVARGYGVANLDHDVPITTRSVFEVGSMTKSFTCVCVALLMDQGKLSPDDDLRKYIPEMPRYDPPITIRHVIRCECGLRNYWHLLPLAGWNLEDAYTEKDILALLALQKRPTFAPGAKFAYGSSGYFLLGVVVERITGKALARFAQENLFRPLGMTNTYLEDDPTRVTRNRAVGYNVSPDGRARRWMMNSNTVGAWGLKTTVEDLFRWDQNFSVNRLRDGPRVREFFRTGTLLDNRKILDAQPVERYRGVKRMAFTGGMPGFVAGHVRFPEQKFSVICLSNDNWRVMPWKTALAIADIYLADHLKDEAKEPGLHKREHTFIDLPQRDLIDKAGAYRMKTTRLIWKVSVVKSQLAITDHLGMTYRWRPVAPTRFRALEGPSKGASTLVFERSGPERPSTMRLEGTGSPVVFESIQVARPDARQLSEYVGRYDCEELQATYTFSVREGHLHLQVHNRRHERLSPGAVDEFIPHLRTPDEGRIITFVRDSKKKITGFTIALWSIRGVRFEKLSR